MRGTEGQSGELSVRLAGPQLLPSVAANVLHLILMPTEECNFRCRYCYEDFQHGKMSPAIVQGIKRYLTQRAPILDQLDLSWFGGEPLLAVDVIEDVLEHAQSLRQRRPELLIRSDITTNGYTLTPQVFRRLLKLGVTRYIISLDGPREQHDRVRVRANGGPTFDRIWNNLLGIHAEPGEFRITVRLHASGANYRELPAFLDLFQAAFGEDPRFEVFLRALSRWGGPHDAELPFLDSEERARVLGDLNREATLRRVRLLEPGEEQGVCYAAAMNSFVVRSDGRLGKCTLALDHPRNQVGRIDSDGRIELELETWLGWSRGLVSGNAEELHCPMRGYADQKTLEPGIVSLRWNRDVA